MKPFLLTSLIFLASLTYAQKKRNVYFLRNDGKHITTRDSADYIRIVQEPDSGSTLFNVFEYYKDDKKKLIGKSSTIDPLKFEEQCIVFYPNGKRQYILNYKNGLKTGDEYDFYPNGQTYKVISYNDKALLYEDYYLIKENYDSLGKVLVVDGNGLYKGYDDEFKFIIEEGKLKNGKRDSMWTGKAPFPNGNLYAYTNFESTKGFFDFQEIYKDGILIGGTAKDSNGKTYTYIKSREVIPRFKGGLNAFYEYLSKNIRYPYEDKKYGVQGKVVLQFVVDTVGAVTDLKILRGVSPTIDAEAKRVLTASPLWIPGSVFGKVASVYYTVPISFSLAR